MGNQQPGTTTAYIAALRASQEHLRELVIPIDPDQIRRNSYDKDWSIAQVLSHLGSQAQIFGQIFDAGLSGGDPPSPESFPAVWDDWNRRSPEDQVTTSIGANDVLLARLEGAEPAVFEGFTVELFGLTIDGPRFCAMRLSEHVVHTWDVDVALDQGAEIPGEAADLILKGTGHLVARTGRPGDRAFDVRIQTSDPERHFTLRVGDGQVELTETPDGSPDPDLALTAGSLVRLLYGRLDDDHGGRIELGVRGLTMDDLRAVFPGP